MDKEMELQVSPDGLLCCTISDDNSAKVYDVVNYDMMSMLRLSFVPGAIEWVCKQGDAKAKLAISELSTPMVHIFDACAHSNEPSDSKKVLHFLLSVGSEMGQIEFSHSLFVA
jgi:peptidylprolyl isomerase domain and WD repeat-containing protein 1